MISNATKKWCKITNFLIAKYKTMSEYDDKRACLELETLEYVLENTGFLKEYKYNDERTIKYE